MRIKVSPSGWLVLILIILVSATFGVIYGRTNYIPEICKNLREQYGNKAITKDHPAYSKYLDSNQNGIVCE